MPQINPGVIIGCPGPAGSPPIMHCYGSGSPVNSTNPLITGAQIGSLYSDYVGGNLWFKGASGWTQVTIP
jgi:hypothetical protein